MLERAAAAVTHFRIKETRESYIKSGSKKEMSEQLKDNGDEGKTPRVRKTRKFLHGTSPVDALPTAIKLDRAGLINAQPAFVRILAWHAERPVARLPEQCSS